MSVGIGEKALGKNPAAHDKRTLELAEYLTGPVLHGNVPLRIPATVPAPDIDWGVLKEPNYSDCVPAALIQLQQVFSLFTQRQRGLLQAPALISNDMALELYTATGGYDPADPTTDRGVTLLHALKWWRRRSQAEKDALAANAAPAQEMPPAPPVQKPPLKQYGLKGILTFAAWEPGNLEQLKGTIATLGGVLLGFRMPLSAQLQRVWSVPPGGPQNWGSPGSWQGHCVPAVGYNAECVLCVTWGGIQPVTWQFIATYCDEGFAVFGDDAPLRVYRKADQAGEPDNEDFVGREAITLPAGPDRGPRNLAQAIYEDTEELAKLPRWGWTTDIIRYPRIQI